MNPKPRDIQPPGFPIHWDCRHFNGYKPCGISPKCEGCESHDPVSERIVIIKLGAMGDVLRTTAILPALRRQWPQAHITWVTYHESRNLLDSNPLIDQVLIWGPGASLWLQAVPFDLLLNYEKELHALALGELMHVHDRRGYRLTSFGSVGIANEEAGYALRLGLDDDLKFRANTKSHQQIAFEMVGLEWDGTLYSIEPSKVSVAKRDAFLAAHPEIGGKIAVGINTGCGQVFPTKRWSEDRVVDLLRLLSNREDVRIVLLGGQNERERNARIIERCGVSMIDSGCENSLEEYIGILMACDAIVSADSLPMHLGIALDRPVVALFGPTAAVEVEVGPRGEKVVTDFECSPCYRTSCDKSPLCMEAMSADEVFVALERVLARVSSESS